MSKFCPMCNEVTNCTENCKHCLEDEAKERNIMYNVIIDAPNEVIKSICHSADEVANLVYKSIGFWQLSKHIREICPNMKVGDVKKLDDAGITIECIV